jgi:hypothetical protein
LVYATERDTVNLVRASNEEQAGLELLQEDDPFALEPTSKKDQDGAGGDGRPEGSRILSLAALFGLLDIVGGVERGAFWVGTRRTPPLLAPLICFSTW